MSVRPSAEGYYEVQVKGGRWIRLRLISDVTFSPTPAPETTETTLDEGEVTNVGSPGTPTYSVTVSLNDASLAYRTLEEAFYEKTSVNQRQVVGQAAINSAIGDGTLAVAANGEVTGGGDLAMAFGTAEDPASPWIPGRMLIGKKNNTDLEVDDIVYLLEGVKDSSTLLVTRVGKVTAIQAGGNATVTPDEEDLAAENIAANWRLTDFAIMESWGGRVTQAGSPTRSGTTRNETIQGNTESRPTKVYLVPMQVT